jgi:serine phosphatase RsbU (regulator of sigma subunit)
VVSIKQAMQLLGLRSVKVLALSFSVVSTLSGDDNFDYEAYWRRSLTMGVAGRMLAKATRYHQSEEAFTAGLLADVGMVAAWRCAKDLYQPVLQARAANQNRTLISIEREMLGVGHTYLSAFLLKTWGLPEDICQAIACHHGEEMEELHEGTKRLALIIWAAADIAALFCKDLQGYELPVVKGHCKDLLGISDEALEQVLVELEVHVRDTADALSLSLGQLSNYAQLQQDASAQLAQLSMQAELERAASSKREEAALQKVDEATSQISEMKTQMNTLEVKAHAADTLQHSVQVASQRQRRLLPAVPPQMAGAQIGVIYSPAEHLSGDFYDFISLDDKGVGLIVGDVSGHGIEAGMLMGICKRSLNQYLRQTADPVKAISLANNDLCQNLDQESFVTACIVVYEPAQQTIMASSAGHTPPLIFKSASRAFMELPCNGPILGVTENMEYQGSAVLPLEPGDIMLLTTDGILECMNSRNEQFGKERMQEVVCMQAGGAAQEIAGSFRRALDEWTGGQAPHDDITVLVLKVQ